MDSQNSANPAPTSTNERSRIQSTGRRSEIRAPMNRPELIPSRTAVIAVAAVPALRCRPSWNSSGDHRVMQNSRLTHSTTSSQLDQYAGRR